MSEEMIVQECIRICRESPNEEVAKTRIIEHLGLKALVCFDGHNGHKIFYGVVTADHLGIPIIRFGSDPNYRNR